MKESNIEQWKPVVGYEGYAVSDKGRVKSVERTCKGKCDSVRRVRERMLKPSKNNKGYLLVRLCKRGKAKQYFIQRLVAQAFIPNPNNLPCVNHKDENPLNNCVENLEWCTYEYNGNYGTIIERLRKIKGKTVYQYTTAHELVKEWQSTREVQRQMGWWSSAISQCCLGKIKTYKGFIWSYEPPT